MARIFVSYKRADKDKVFPLVEKIEQQVHLAKDSLTLTLITNMVL